MLLLRNAIGVIFVLVACCFLFVDSFNHHPIFKKPHSCRSRTLTTALAPYKRKVYVPEYHISTNSIYHPSRLSDQFRLSMSTTSTEDAKEIHFQKDSLGSILTKTVRAIKCSYCKFISTITQPFVDIWHFFLPKAIQTNGTTSDSSPKSTSTIESTASKFYSFPSSIVDETVQEVKKLKDNLSNVSSTFSDALQQSISDFHLKEKLLDGKRYAEQKLKEIEASRLFQRGKDENETKETIETNQRKDDDEDEDQSLSKSVSDLLSSFLSNSTERFTTSIRSIESFSEEELKNKR
jgi:hypothetical protein